MTVYEIAILLRTERGLETPTCMSGDDFAEVGLPITGGCQTCGACVAAYNAHPQTNGYLSCRGCSTNPIVDMEQWHDLNPEEEGDET